MCKCLWLSNWHVRLLTWFRYGVYAAVFPYKVVASGAYSTQSQKWETASLAQRFILAMDESASSESHVCRRYSCMLRKLWIRSDGDATKSQPSTQPHTERMQSSTASKFDESTNISQADPLTDQVENDHLASLLDPSLDALFYDTLSARDLASLAVDAQLFGPFLPNAVLNRAIPVDSTQVQLLPYMDSSSLECNDQNFAWDHDFAALSWSWKSMYVYMSQMYAVMRQTPTRSQRQYVVPCAISI